MLVQCTLYNVTVILELVTVGDESGAAVFRISIMSLKS
jgi:hypothetical protein